MTTPSETDDFEQLELEIRPAPPPPPSPQTEPEHVTKRLPWLLIPVLAAIFLISTQFQFESEKPAARPEPLSLKQNERRLTKAKFPPIPASEPFAILQVGLFKQLEGAERHQMKMAAIGLLPTVRKRTEESAVFYVVLIESLDESTHTDIILALDQAGIPYFQPTTIH